MNVGDVASQDKARVVFRICRTLAGTANSEVGCQALTSRRIIEEIAVHKPLGSVDGFPDSKIDEPSVWVAILGEHFINRSASIVDWQNDGRFVTAVEFKECNLVDTACASDTAVIPVAIGEHAAVLCRPNI